MNKFTFLFSSILLLLFASCTSEDDCMKTIIVQPELTISTPSGTSFIPEITQDVPCDFPEPEVAQSIGELPKLTEFSYEILAYNFVPDTGNNTGRIQFKIQLNNESNAAVKGFPYVTTEIGGGLSASRAFDGCEEIPANSSCTFEYDEEYSLNLGIIDSYTILDVAYLLIQ